MPRFVARPIVVTAFQYDGHLHLLPEAFRLAVRRRLPGGEIDVMCGFELRRCAHGDWIVHGPDGLFSILRLAAFETSFVELAPASLYEMAVTIVNTAAAEQVEPVPVVVAVLDPPVVARSVPARRR